MFSCDAVKKWVWLQMRVGEGAERAARVMLPGSRAPWPLAEKHKVTVPWVLGCLPLGCSINTLGAEAFWLNSVDFLLCLPICFTASEAREGMCTEAFLLTQVALWGPASLWPHGTGLGDL